MNATTPDPTMKKPIWHGNPTPESANARGAGTMVSHLDIRITEIGPDYLRATMPVDARTVQPHGILHGGASVALAETVGSMAAAFVVDQATHYCVGLDINANHVRAVREGIVVGTARPIHLGRSTQVWETEIRDGDDRLVSIGRLTMAVLRRS